MSVQPLSFAAADDGEELARADTYGLLARLYLEPPDAALLQQFAVAVTQAAEPGAFLAPSWQALVSALRGTTPQAAAEEFDALFQGVGKPEVFLFGSFYLSGFLNEKPLAQLRADLAELGLTRDDAAGETEDHVAYGFEVMRWLIAGDDPMVCNLERQRRFFRSHLQPWVERLCETLQAHPRARVWSALADYTRAFMQVETQGFDMIE